MSAIRFGFPIAVSLKPASTGSGIAQKKRLAVMDARPFPRPESDPQPPRIISGCGR